MKDFPQVETKRLVMNRWKWTDVPAITEYAGNDNVASKTVNIPHPYYEEDAVAWISATYRGYEDKTQYAFAIRTKSTGEFIGGIGLRVETRFDRAELGYWLAEPFWGNGYATEASSAVLRFGFEKLVLNKIYATHLTDNPASGKVMIKNGMIKEGELKEHTKREGIYRSIVQYRLTRSEYEEINRNSDE